VLKEERQGDRDLSGWKRQKTRERQGDRDLSGWVSE